MLRHNRLSASGFGAVMLAIAGLSPALAQPDPSRDADRLPEPAPAVAAPEPQATPQQASPEPARPQARPRARDAAQPRPSGQAAPAQVPTPPQRPDLAETPQRAAPPQAAPASPPAPVAAPAPATVPANEGPGELQTIQHARDAGVRTCTDYIVQQSSALIDRPHTAASTWTTSAPNDNAFQSIVGLSYPNKVAPNGVVVLLAAPLPTGNCGGGGVIVYPTTLSCSAVQANLVKQGKTLGTLQKLPLIETSDGTRNILMPTAGGGCTVVNVRYR